LAKNRSKGHKTKVTVKFFTPLRRERDLSGKNELRDLKPPEEKKNVESEDPKARVVLVQMDAAPSRKAQIGGKTLGGHMEVSFNNRAGRKKKKEERGERKKHLESKKQGKNERTELQDGIYTHS